MQQALADMGYNKEARNKLTPAEAHAILSGRMAKERVSLPEGNTSPDNGWDLLHSRWETAMDALENVNTIQSNEILHLTGIEADPDVLYAFLERQRAHLSPTEIEALNASIAVKTKARDQRV
jgi:hypothetical protein